MPPPDPGTLQKRLRLERERNRLWRARELAAIYPTLVYDRALWLECGVTLLHTHDLERAGRLLFFAGSDDPEHRTAIDLYLDRNDRERIGRHLTALPAQANLLESTLAELRARNIEAPRPRRASPPRSGRRSSLVGWTIAAAVLALLALLLVGLITTIQWTLKLVIG